MKKIAVITGASSGIGREFVRTLSSHGQYDELWAIARDTARLEQLRSETPIPVVPISLDLSRPESVTTYASMLAEHKPGVSILINCSGYGKFESTQNISLEDNLGMIDLNCRALTAMTYVTLPYMNRGGEIIEIASVAAFQPIPYINVYGASKAYVLSFTRALSRELRPNGIHVMAVCPFWTKTAFFDRAVKKNSDTIVKKYTAMYTPEQIVGAAWKAMKHPNKDYCVPGFKAKMQVFGVKVLPHKWVMGIWMRQQKLK